MIAILFNYTISGNVTVSADTAKMNQGTFTVTGTGGEDRLEFRELESEDNSLGGLLDNISLRQVGGATETGADFIQVITASPEGGGLLQENAVAAHEFRLPSGWQLRTEAVTKRTVIDLPHPTEAWFFSNGSSFQGPVTLLS